MENQASTISSIFAVTEDVKSGDGDARHLFSERVTREATQREATHIMRRLGWIAHPVLDSPPHWS